MVNKTRLLLVIALLCVPSLVWADSTMNVDFAFEIPDFCEMSWKAENETGLDNTDVPMAGTLSCMANTRVLISASVGSADLSSTVSDSMVSVKVDDGQFIPLSVAEERTILHSESGDMAEQLIVICGSPSALDSLVTLTFTVKAVD